MAISKQSSSIQVSSLTPNANKAEDERLAIMITAKGIDCIEAILLSEAEDN